MAGSLAWFTRHGRRGLARLTRRLPLTGEGGVQSTQGLLHLRDRLCLCGLGAGRLCLGELLPRLSELLAGGLQIRLHALRRLCLRLAQRRHRGLIRLLRLSKSLGCLKQLLLLLRQLAWRRATLGSTGRRLAR